MCETSFFSYLRIFKKKISFDNLKLSLSIFSIALFRVDHFVNEKLDICTDVDV